MGKYTPQTAPYFVQEVLALLADFLSVPIDTLYRIAIAPPQPEHGDLAIGMFTFAKAKQISPVELAKQCAAKIPSSHAVGPYLNIVSDKKRLARDVILALQQNPSTYGHQPKNPRVVTVIDYSSPNIAKPLAFHHIRSTMIGQALVRILQASGHTVHKINYLGDWGTQFGYIIHAAEQLSAAEQAALTLEDLITLYVTQRARAKEDPLIDAAARACFVRLEQGEARAKKIWQQARQVTIARFKQVYQRLGVDFSDSDYIGESFFEPDLVPTIEEAIKAGITSESEGALIVDLKQFGINTPCLLRKADGATLYATREIASARYRYHHYQGPQADKFQALYVVDQGQALHFKQLTHVLALLGDNYHSYLHHVPFGVLLMWSEEEQAWLKGKTRAGNAILLEDVLNEAKRRVLEVMHSKQADFAQQEEIADAIGMGAVVFNDLKHKRTNDVKFKYDEALALEGETGPYIHNALVRAKSIIRKAKETTWLVLNQQPALTTLSADDLANQLTHHREIAIFSLLADYQAIIARAAEELDPSIMARFLLDLSAAFHAFHHDCQVLDQTNIQRSTARLALSEIVVHVLLNAMHLIGLKDIDHM